MPALHVVILAAGSGKRMNSELPKVLHLLAGVPMIEHVLSTAAQLRPQSISVVYGYQGDKVRESVAPEYSHVQWVYQQEQLGTGHAVHCALSRLASDGRVLVLYGDVPLVSEVLLRQFLDVTGYDDVGIITTHLSDPAGYGRVIRDSSGEVLAIVEQADATPETLAINEINTGILVASSEYLKQNLPNLSRNNAQSEYYLTEVVGLAIDQGREVKALVSSHCEETLGVNTRQQLAHLERYYQRKQTEKLMNLGVSFSDPNRFDLRGTLSTGKDVFIDINVVCEGRVRLADGVRIGPNVLLKNCEIGSGTEIKANSIIEDSQIADNCMVGPFARIRPNSVLANEVHIGNFVEIKKSTVGTGSKINHLSYIGDAKLGSQVNIGAGTITCNYDGVSKHQTVIGDGVFVGSDTQFIAPVSIGENATIAAGSTVRKDVDPDTLVITHRIQQRNVPGWKRPEKQPKKETK